MKYLVIVFFVLLGGCATTFNKCVLKYGDRMIIIDTEYITRIDTFLVTVHHHDTTKITIIKPVYTDVWDTLNKIKPTTLSSLNGGDYTSRPVKYSKKAWQQKQNKSKGAKQNRVRKPINNKPRNGWQGTIPAKVTGSRTVSQ